ncbi:MAG TPA: thioredoxin domain-containing protein [Candidatus Limnocylindrales bacterium]
MRRANREKRGASRRDRRNALPKQSGFGIGLGTISAIAGIGGVALIAILLITQPRPASMAPAASPSPVVVAAVPAALERDGLTLGRADAPVRIDVFEDFQCPACLHWGRTVFPDLAAGELRDGRAKLVFHGYAFIGPESRDAERAAWAAARQDRFWDMWSTLYANQGPIENGGAFTRDRLVAMAGAIGLDGVRFERDLDSAESASAVAAGASAAQAAGISSTPTVVVNGRAVAGGTYADLSAAIQRAAGAPAP